MEDLSRYQRRRCTPLRDRLNRLAEEDEGRSSFREVESEEEGESRGGGEEEEESSGGESDAVVNTWAQYGFLFSIELPYYLAFKPTSNVDFKDP